MREGHVARTTIESRHAFALQDGLGGRNWAGVLCVSALQACLDHVYSRELRDRDGAGAMIMVV